MAEEHVTFASEDDLSLAGVLHIPERPPTAVAVLAHGILTHKDYAGFFPSLARQLGRRKIGSLRFDFRGHGDSQGELEAMTLAGEVEDLHAAVGVLQSRFQGPVAVVGVSLGAAVAVLYSAGTERSPHALVLLSPILDLQRAFLEPETPWAKRWFSASSLRQARSRGVLPVGDVRLGLGLLREFETLHPNEALLELDVPVLMIHSDQDPVASYAAAREAAEAAAGVVFVGMDEGEHYFEGAEDRVFRRVADWIAAQLPPRGPSLGRNV